MRGVRRWTSCWGQWGTRRCSTRRRTWMTYQTARRHPVPAAAARAPLGPTRASPALATRRACPRPARLRSLGRREATRGPMGWAEAGNGCEGGRSCSRGSQPSLAETEGRADRSARLCQRLRAGGVRSTSVRAQCVPVAGLFTSISILWDLVCLV